MDNGRNRNCFCEGNRPLARLLTLTSAPSPRQAGLQKGAIQVSADFDDPLPDDFYVTGA